MNANREPENDRRLDEVLRKWTVTEAMPPRFQEGVWKRIASSEALPEPGVGGILVRLIQVILPRPRVALAYVTVLVALGGLAGSWAAQARSSRMNEALGSRYVQSIDPYGSFTAK